MQRKRPLTQQYEQYTKEDFLVWQILFDRQMKLLNKYASSEYLNAINQIGFQAGRIPNFTEVNETLQAFTGWKLKVVPALVPEVDFFEMLSRKIFPATCWLRTMTELDYIEEPDMFHDVFGHVPLLINPDYALFMQAFGTLALESIDKTEIIRLLSRIYWFTIEFGLIKESNSIKIYGAGILSSPGETLNSINNAVMKKPFNTEEILNTAYRTDVLQEQYFVTTGFAQLFNMLPNLKQLIYNKKPISST